MADSTSLTTTSRYRSRKFLLSCYFAAIATAALFTGFLKGGEFVEVTLAILGTHHLANWLAGRSTA